MTIICLEGASGVGKSTAAKFMEREYGFVRIPEVNELFIRSSNEPDNWYLEMQVKRWELAKNASLSGKVAILDGDHLQPVWYNWIFDDLNFQPVEAVLAFYSRAFLAGKMNFPDAYVVLQLEMDRLRSRKESDKNRGRSNFEMHLRLIKPQRKYFEALQSSGMNGVNFVHATTPNDIADLCCTLQPENIASDSNRPKFDIVESFFKTKITNKGIGRDKR